MPVALVSLRAVAPCAHGDVWHDDRPSVVTCHMAGVNTSINCIHPYRVGDRMINPINAESGQLVIHGHKGIVQRAAPLVAFLRLRAL